MKRLARYSVVFAAAGITACTSVSSVEPVGEHPKELSQKEWEGTWMHRDHPVVVRVADARKGLLDVAWAEEKGGAFKLESYQVALRQSGEHAFGNVRETGDKGPYYWGLVSKDEGQIVVWTPDPAQCAKLVESGVLHGSIEKGGDVILEKLAPEKLELVVSPQGGCLRWTQPVVFFRIGG